MSAYEEPMPWEGLAPARAEFLLWDLKMVILALRSSGVSESDIRETIEGALK